MDNLIDRLTCEEMVNAVGENDMFLEGPGLEWVARYARCHGNEPDELMMAAGGVRKRTFSA